MALGLRTLTCTALSLVVLCAGLQSAEARRSLSQLQGQDASIERAVDFVSQVAALAPAPTTNDWASETTQGPALGQSATFANKLESAVAAGLPGAVAQLFGSAGNPLSSAQTLQYLQSAIVETAQYNAEGSYAPAPATMPASTINAAAQQLAGIIVGSTVDTGLRAETVSDSSSPDFANSQLADLFEAAAEDIATGIDELVPSTPPSTPYSGDVVQSLVRRGLVQPSYAATRAFPGSIIETILEALALQVRAQGPGTGFAAAPQGAATSSIAMG